MDTSPRTTSPDADSESCSQVRLWHHNIGSTRSRICFEEHHRTRASSYHGVWVNERAFELKSGNRYILMTRCSGVRLCNVFRTLSAKERGVVLLHLRGFIDELRVIVPPKPGHIGSTDYTPIHDEHVHSLPCGPFDSIADVHKAIRGGPDGPTGHDELDMMISTQDSRSYQVKFTHGDLAFRNILYEHGKITGIVDWESSGWYPDYWEYPMTWESFWDNPDLRDRIDDFLEPFPEQLKMERTRRRLLCGDWVP